MNRIFCRNFVFFSFSSYHANLSNMDANKGYFKCSCETMGFISSVSRTPIFFFSTTVAISSRRLSPLSDRA